MRTLRRIQSLSALPFGIALGELLSGFVVDRKPGWTILIVALMVVSGASVINYHMYRHAARKAILEAFRLALAVGVAPEVAYRQATERLQKLP